MSYSYIVERPWTLTDDGQKKLFEVFAKARRLCADAGAVRCDKILGTGNTWQSLAAIDRLIELGELREVPTTGAAQYRIFVVPHAD